MFTPRTAIIRRNFEQELPAWISQLPQVEEEWDANLQTYEGQSGWVRSMAFTPDGSVLASGSDDKTVRLWSPATGTLTRTLQGHLGPIYSVAFSPDGRLLASGSGDKTVCIWDPVTGTLIQFLEGHSNWVFSVAFSPDSRLLASSSGDKTVRLWNLATGTLSQTCEGHSGWIHSVAFSPDCRLLASGSGDKTVRLWDTATGSLKQTLQGHSGPVHIVAFSPDGRLLASSSGDDTVRLWDPAIGAFVQTWNFDEPVYTLEFFHDGSYLHTNLGTIQVQYRCDIPKSRSPHNGLHIPIEGDPWIKLNSENVLWLPIQYRPSCLQIKGNIVALGQALGRVLFVGVSM